MQKQDGAMYLPVTVRLFGDRIVARLLEWFAREGRTFLWRTADLEKIRSENPIHDPYLILISEVMLQQTQTARVAAKLPGFLARFPTIEALAAAPRAELLRAWQGMGYNRRALRLQETAQTIVNEHGGRFPRTLAELTRLPGVGRYTASAIACFAFGEEVPVIDVNVIRVLSRLFFKCHTVDARAPERSVTAVAEAIVPSGDAYRWHQGLMDLGATICVARRPLCSRCPLEDLCLSAHPRGVELYEAGRKKGNEPSLRGIPRRLWRGRIVEVLRSTHEPIRLGEIVNRLSGEVEESLSSDERRWLIGVAGMLLEEGLIERPGVVREGALSEEDLVALPA